MIPNVGSAKDKSQKYTEVKSINLAKILGTKSQWNVSVFHVVDVAAESDAGDIWTDKPAKICFWTDSSHKESNCMKAVSGTEKIFSVKELKLIPLTSKEKGILFEADRTYDATYISYLQIWRYDTQNDSFKLVMQDSFSDAYYEIMPADKNRAETFILTAKSIWNIEGGECRVCPHKQIISIYKYRDKFDKVKEYTTKAKYDMETDFIKIEMKNIKKYLK
jgi:hypothetical protein